ncbi:sepiapterin reductase-like [Tigriopus californicus]|uniref:sepiapterin reductase-like n=1 Tax=Tigriopus californicus TaxID=6832 RepID=UPI0027DA1BEE|nr:sepiapterin reductase-like [Tigriopus californicus]
MKSLVIITGASRGFGRAVAEALCQNLVSEGSCILLMARSQAGLEATAQSLKTIQPNSIKVQCCRIDLAHPDETVFRTSIQEALSKFEGDLKQFEQAVVVHNAGTMSPQGLMTWHCSKSTDLAAYFAMNLSSTMVLNSVLHEEIFAQVPKAVVVNVSSLAAVEAIISWSLYCTGKAARDMYFKCLAQECPQYRVLNYAPGPLDTDMIAEVLADPKIHPEIQKIFEELVQQGNLLQPKTSADKLAQVLKADEFVSGSHVDYFNL